MVRLAVMLVATVVIVLLVRVYTNRDADSPALMRGAYLYRVYYDGNIITYADPQTGRVYPGIIDVDRFTTAQLDKTFNERQQGRDFAKIASTMTLSITSQCPYSIAEPTIYNNKDTYTLYSALTGLKGPGGATSENIILPVNARKGAQDCAAQLNITIVRPNT